MDGVGPAPTGCCWLVGSRCSSGPRTAYRFRIAIKTIDSKRALKQFRSPAEIDQQDLGDGGRPFRGHLLDLRTLVFALTNSGHSLASACTAFGVEHGKDEPPAHGTITAEYVTYNRHDVRATAELYAAAMTEYLRHPIELQETQAYSPASIAKSYLRAQGITPVLARQPDFPVELLGAAMSAFYGGRAECTIRRVPLPVQLVDFTSMYPTVDTLLGLWQLLTADRVDPVEATDQVRDLLADDQPRRLFRPGVVAAAGRPRPDPPGRGRAPGPGPVRADQHLDDRGQPAHRRPAAVVHAARPGRRHPAVRQTAAGAPRDSARRLRAGRRAAAGPAPRADIHRPPHRRLLPGGRRAGG